MENKEWSKAFTAYKEFKDAVVNDPANKAEGTHTFTQKDGKVLELPNLHYTVSKMEDYMDKEGKTNHSFTVGKFGAENIKFVLADSGSLRGAEYLDFTGVEKGQKLPEDRKTWVGKDFDKLSGLIKDPLLKDIAGKMDWTKAADKAKEEVEEPDEGLDM